MKSFEKYVEDMITADELDPEPICMFPHWDAECYVDRRDPEHGCINCPAAKKSYMDNEITSFEQYVEHMIKTEDENPYSDPVCMFPHWNAECYVDRRDPEHGCLNCPAAKKSYEKLKSEE